MQRGYYELFDPTRGNGYTVTMAGQNSAARGVLLSDVDNVWANGNVSFPQTDAVDAHFGISATWDFYKSTFGRNGIANNGVGAMSRVHYGIGYANAFWADGCFCMSFGDGMTALDVAGHEMSHGVTARSAGLAYEGDAGGLNEATSDIFGTMVEFFVNDPVDPPNYLMGEKLPEVTHTGPESLALRYMFKPSIDEVGSADCYSSSVAQLDPHYSSGIGNHFFYLLAEGATVPDGFGAGSVYALTPEKLVCNGNTNLQAIGRADAEQIWYLALTGYMTSQTTYPQVRQYTLQAATDLYGASSPQVAAVAAAWSAVSVE